MGMEPSNQGFGGKFLRKWHRALSCVLLLSPNLGGTQNKQDFPQVLRTWGEGSLQNLMGGGVGLESIQWGGGGWNARGGQGKGKYLVNICTVAFKLKKVIFLLN